MTGSIPSPRLIEETWRWFGPDDDVKLWEIRQTGATGIVTALHQIPYGEIWPVEEIEARKRMIEDAGLRWSVVESLPIHERVKLDEGDLTPILDNYRQSLRNLAACGIRTVCYNFMPVIDWTRTDLDYRLPNRAGALRFDAARFAAFDIWMLQRPGAEADHHPDAVRRGKAWFDTAGEGERDSLLAAIMAGLPGAYDRYDVAGLRSMLARYAGVDAETLRSRLTRFLAEVVPLAEELGMRMCIHPDDPPRPLMGLPRVVSNADDLDRIVSSVPSSANGITFCTGSLGAGAANDVPAMARRFAPHIAFGHLRNVRKEDDTSFFEADHLDGDTDMVAVIRAFVAEAGRRFEAGEATPIPIRPDHGHLLLSDTGRNAFPGYSLLGRMKGLAELRGVIRAVAA
jgi:mannonate dehydratase